MVTDLVQGLTHGCKFEVWGADPLLLFSQNLHEGIYICVLLNSHREEIHLGFLVNFSSLDLCLSKFDFLLSNTTLVQFLL